MDRFQPSCISLFEGRAVCRRNQISIARHAAPFGRRDHRFFGKTPESRVLSWVSDGTAFDAVDRVFVDILAVFHHGFRLDEPDHRYSCGQFRSVDGVGLNVLTGVGLNDREGVGLNVFAIITVGARVDS